VQLQNADPQSQMGVFSILGAVVTRGGLPIRPEEQQPAITPRRPMIRIDARKLAELLRGNHLKPVYHGEAACSELPTNRQRSDVS
jgi:hypothetical protein